MDAKGKGKGPAVAEVAPVDGAKFATVRAGTSETAITVMINLNCPVDIILDNVKRIFLKRIDGHIQELTGVRPKTGTQQLVQTNTDIPGGEHSEQTVALIAKLTEIKQRLSTPDNFIEFIDTAGATTNCEAVRSLYFASICFNTNFLLTEFKKICL